jgi:hypothetical protein
MVTSYPLSTPGSVGYPFHVVDDSGKVIRSFGSSNPVVLPAASPREPAVSETGTFFVMPVQRDRVWTVNRDYRITSWPVSGGAGTAYMVRAPWLANAHRPTESEIRQQFEELAAAAMQGRPLQLTRATPGHGISLLHVDAESNLAWFSVDVVFQRGSVPAGLESCRRTPWKIAPELNICWGLEVIDLTQRRRIAWLDVDGPGYFIPQTDFYYTVREDSTGISRINVFRASVQGR